MSKTATMAERRPKRERQTRDVVRTFRTTQEWDDCFDRLVDHCNDQSPVTLGPADIISIAVAEYAAKVGFPDKFPKR